MHIDETIEAAQADYFWAPDDVNVVVRPEVTYTWSDRPELFFNCVVRVRPELCRPRELVHEVSQRHDGHGSRWSLNPMSDTAPMRQALTDAGYAAGARHHAYVIRPQDYSRQPSRHVQVRRVTDMAQLLALYEVRAEVFGVVASQSESDLADDLQMLTMPGARASMYLASVDGQPAGGGGMTCFEELGFAFIWGGGVTVTARGQGVYTALLHARAEVARTRDIGLLGLYARDTTSGPIVAAHGFTRHGQMIHWDRAAQPQADASQ